MQQGKGGIQKGETAAIDKNTRGTNAYISGGLSTIAQRSSGSERKQQRQSPFHGTDVFVRQVRGMLRQRRKGWGERGAGVTQEV
jgi:hypothetical protein